MRVGEREGVRKESEGEERKIYNLQVIKRSVSIRSPLPLSPDITADSSRSSTFGVTSPMSSLTPETMFRSASPRRESEDKRLDDLFSQSFQREQDLLQAKNYRPVDTLSVKLQAVSKEAEEKTSGTWREGGGE